MAKFVAKKIIKAIKERLNLNENQCFLWNDIFHNAENPFTENSNDNPLYKYNFVLIVRPESNRQVISFGQEATTKPNIENPDIPYNIKTNLYFQQQFTIIVMTKKQGVDNNDSAETYAFKINSILMEYGTKKLLIDNNIIFYQQPTNIQDTSYNETSDKITRVDMTYNVKYIYTTNEIETEYTTEASIKNTEIIH